MIAIDIEERATIPVGAGDDLESFRRWARSDDLPRSGRFAFLSDRLWMDLSMEELFRHNRLLARCLATLEPLPETAALGYLFWQRVLYSNAGCGLSTEPDLLLVTYEQIAEGIAELVRGDDGTTGEVIGTVAMTLEIVSKTSVRKDTVSLRDLYHGAGVGEFWLIDPRRSPARFEILQWRPEGYVAVPAVDGWLRSELFGRSFRLEESVDPLGNPAYALLVN